MAKVGVTLPYSYAVSYRRVLSTVTQNNRSAKRVVTLCQRNMSYDSRSTTIALWKPCPFKFIDFGLVILHRHATIADYIP